MPARFFRENKSADRFSGYYRSENSISSPEMGKKLRLAVPRVAINLPQLADPAPKNAQNPEFPAKRAKRSGLRRS